MTQRASLAGRAILGASLLLGVAPAAEGRQSVPFEYTHEMVINNNTAVATGFGTMDFGDGTMRYRTFLSPYIPGYGFWPVSPVTLSVTGRG